MTALVGRGEVRDAYERAAALGLTAVEEGRWQQVLHWAAGLPDAARDLDAAGPLLDVFTGHHRDPAGGPPPVDPELRDRLAEWFAQRGVTVATVTAIAGGFSRLMLDVTWSLPRRGRAVVRIEQDGMFGTDGAREVSVLRVVGSRRFPVPTVLWEEPDARVLGRPFFVMSHVPGAARTDDVGLDDMVRSVAALHRLDVTSDLAALDGLPAAAGPEAAIAAQLTHWHRVYRSCVDDPIAELERAFDWLDAHLRPTGPTVVVHGDPGPGNALQDAHGVTAVIDWEFAHVGDAAEDWAYLALVRGRRLGPPEVWKGRLRRVVDVGFDEDTWRAWEAFSQVRGACVNLTALDVFRRSPTPTPDHLAIGVAVHLRFLARAVELTS